MIGAFYNQRIYMFMASSHLVFRGTELVTVDGSAQAVHVDPETDTLYISSSNLVYPYGTGSNRTLTWRSAYFRYPSLQTWGAVRIFADGYPVTFNMYRNGTTVSISVTSSDSVVLPRETSAVEWLGFEVVASSGVSRIEIAESRGEL